MPGWYNLRCLDCSHTEYRYRNVKTCRQCGSHNVERVPDMPHVDTSAPLATNSDAAMWRQDHDAAIRYIEVLLAERKRWAGVIEAAKKYNDAVMQWWSQIFGDISDERRFALVNAMEKAKDALALGVVETFEEMGKGNPDATKRKQSSMNVKWRHAPAKEVSDE
jgi:hypothetical protein